MRFSLLLAVSFLYEWAHPLSLSKTKFPICQRTTTSPTCVKSSLTDELIIDKIFEGGNEDASQRKIRPLHQNWWPVTTLEALDSSRPNVVKLLGMDLVLFQSRKDDGSVHHDAGQWSCLEDCCPHRCAPLSEGRIVNSGSIIEGSNMDNHLQCAYHGWEFDNDGSCQQIPQLENGKKIAGCDVKQFPTRIDSGMVFVWADPETANLGQLIPLPIFPSLRKSYEKNGPSTCYMRDLPYGYELLGENLLDLSHLPFSHHSVGSLKRDLGGPLPFKMLSSSERSPDNPLYEAVLDNAAMTDPIMSANPMTPKNATLNLGFYEPCHIRYTRKSTSDFYVALFFCPTSASKSRVFLYNVYFSQDEENNDSNLNDIKTKLKKVMKWTKPSFVKQKFKSLVLGIVFTPVFRHKISHKIFDGDGIFLRMQGDRMQRKELSFRDYKTPTSSDLLVNTFRRYLNTASKLTEKEGKGSIAEAANSKRGYDNILSREQMLDRYNSHTKNCQVCSMALKAKQNRKKQLEAAQTIFNGGIGASLTMFVTALSLLSSEVSIPTKLLRIMSITLLTCIGTSIGLSKLNENNDKAIKAFIFEDYIHAEKD